MKGASADKPAPRRASEEDAHQKLDTRLLLRLWAFLVPYRWAAFGCLILSLVIAGLRLGQPLVVHNILESVDPEALPGVDRLEVISRHAALFFGLVVAILGLEIAFNYATGVIGQRSMHDLRAAIFRKVHSLDAAFFDKTPVGRLITRMTSDVATLNDLFSTGVIAILADTLMLGGLLAVMFAYSWRLSLIVLCSAPFMYLIVMLFRRNSRRWYLESRARLAQVNAFLQENIAGMKTVQSFNREGRNHGQFVDLNAHYREAQIHTILAFALFFPAMNVVLYLTLTAIIWFGARWLAPGATAVADFKFATLFLVVQCVNMLFNPLRNLSERYNLLQAAMASSSRIFGLLDTPRRIEAPADPVRIERFERAIAFEDVKFEYHPGEPVIRGVSFEVPRGSTTAIVGATGSGKTTLVSLLTRFYDVTEGRIAIDGVDIRRFDPAELRRLFAVVLQEVFLFSDTVAQNIRLANPELGDERIWEILRQVHADDFVRALPGGIEAKVGERGAMFSTGQKQLLAFARALAADPQILILDEATANIDTATEHKIQDAIGRLLVGRTALVIAHRLSTIQNADRIIVMHHGCIRESGTHDQLIAADGLYRRLYELQFRPQGATHQVGDVATRSA
jgi:ATP-binding cassette subfamily B protein